ncbi:NAD-dependent epimerase/dehydratase family protein [Ghiorsea bivora]|uniref:NAD-dependent epimerase/dehydratase family protein n=1 Tax=Ghiorsea bivora TaxID=1485545 RepID=UPI00056FB135|nr:NAD-dependent epimerase/dehydratase family protein [Ghiorsea bivora]
MKNEGGNGKIACITGASGMIGLHITQRLLKMGYLVRVLTRNTAFVLESVECFKGSLSEANILEKMLQDADVVFHCAAEINDETKMFDVNVKGTHILLEAMKAVSTIQYFCYLSSAGVVGPTSDLIVDEETICEPNNAYERSKFEAEQLVLNADLAMNVCVLRPANVFDVHKPGVLSYAQNHSLKDKLSVFMKGYEGAHLVHAKDVAEAGLYFMDKRLMKPEVFFVSYDDDTRNTVLGVYNLCCSMQGNLGAKILFALPNMISHFVRQCKQGKSLHGRVRFSEKKLRSAGFMFSLGLEKAISDVCGKALNKL